MDFNWAKQQIGESDKPNADNVVTDGIWFLLNYNLKNLSKINPHADALALKTYGEDVRELILGFSEEQRQWRKR